MCLFDTAVYVPGLPDIRPHDVGETGSPVTEAEGGHNERKNPGKSSLGQEQQIPGGSQCIELKVSGPLCVVFASKPRSCGNTQ